MSISKVRDALNMGAGVSDVGQLDKDVKAYLRRLLKLDLVEVEVSRRFGQAKRTYMACTFIPELA